MTPLSNPRIYLPMTRIITILTLAYLTCVAPGRSWAQVVDEPPVETAPTPAVEDAPTTPAVEDAPTAPAVEVVVTNPEAPEVEPIQVSGEGMMMNFKDAPLELVLRELSQQLGLIIVDGSNITGRVSIVSGQPLSTDEAVAALNSALKSNGLTAIRTGRSLRIVKIDEAKQANIPVRAGSDLEKLTDTDVMVTQVIPIRYAEADKLKTDLAQLIPAYAHLTSNIASNTLIYTATEADVRHLAQLVRALDVQLAEADNVQVFALKFADATNTATLIEKVFNQNRTGGTTNQQRGGFAGRGPGGRDQPAAETTTNIVRQQRVSAAAAMQTNAVVVTAPPEIMTIIAAVIEDLDANPTAEESIFVYPLTNAKASDLEPVLQNIFSVSTSNTTGAGRTTTTGGRTTTTGTSPFAGRFGGLTGGATPGAGTGISADAISDLAGKVYVVAESATNSLLVRTAPKYFERVKAILKDLDRSTRQVLIKVLIAEVTHDNSRDLGAEFSVLNLNIDGGKGTIATDMGLSTLTSGGVVKFVSADFQATLRALERVGKLDVLSRPYLLASENQAAAITVGEEVPYITNSRVTDAGQTINTVEYRDIGIILEVTPYIGPDGMVILDVNQEISSRTGRTLTVSENFEAEVFAKRSAQTRVAVTNGQTVVIGGLMQDQVTKTQSKVPILGDIPLAGAAFRRTQNAKTKTELLIFLCPQTALTPAELQAVSDKTKSHASEIHDAVEEGSLERSMKELELPAPPNTQGDEAQPAPAIRSGL